MRAQCDREVVDVIHQLILQGGHLVTHLRRDLVGIQRGDLVEKTTRGAQPRRRSIQLAEEVATRPKRVGAVGESATPRELSHSIEAMADLVMEQVEAVVEEHDAPALARLRDDDERIDEKYTSVFRELLTYMMEDPRNITPCTHLLFIAKNLERIGDHATNIAETVYYAVKGENLPDARPKGDTSAYAVVRPREQQG